MVKLVDLTRRVAAPLMAAGLAIAAVPASAMTTALVPAASDAPAVTLVSGGCGIYAHRTVYGYCRPNIVGYRYGYGYRRFGFRPFWGWRGYGWHGYGWHRHYGWRRGW